MSNGAPTPNPTDHAETGYELYWDSNAMAQLARGTAVAIASMLAVPDAIGLLPGSKDLVDWGLAIIGIWISAAVLWFVSFLGILHAVALMAGPMALTSRGIKMWRFAKPIPLDRIEAVFMEPQMLFSRIFSTTTIAMRLTIFAKSASRLKFTELVPHEVPSFLFQRKEFLHFFTLLCQMRFGLGPDAAEVLLSRQESVKSIRRTYKVLNVQRQALTVLMAIGLIVFLGRRSIVQYSYNNGNKAMAQADYDKAKERYHTAVSFDPTYAVAWNGLAQAEFRLGDEKNAIDHWQNAIRLKPDYVEPRLGLAFVTIEHRRFQQAKTYIESALVVDPLNAHALLNRAACNMAMGRFEDCINDARLVMSIPTRGSNQAQYKAQCLLARAKIRLGDPRGAVAIISRLPSFDGRRHESEQNLRYRSLVIAEAEHALGHNLDAEKIALETIAAEPRNIQLLFDLVQIELDLGHSDRAQARVDQLKEFAPENPWTYLASAKVNKAMGKDEAARDDLIHLIKSEEPDADSLSSAAVLFMDLKDYDKAISLAHKALSIEPKTPNAKTVIAQLKFR